MSGKPRFLRYSLRSFMILVTCVALVCAWFAYHGKQRKTAFATIREAGGEIQWALREPSLLEKWFGAEQFRHVVEVDLREGNVDNDLLRHVGVLRELRRLDLSNAQIDDEGVRRITHLPLRQLWLQKTNITDASADAISKVKTLNFLQLNATSISDAFLGRLEPLPKLKNFGLRGTQVTSAGMKYLSRHPKLADVDVYHTDVDDFGVQSLVECQSLTSLGLSSTRITDQVFQHLAKLPNLTDADLNANRAVTTKAVLEFEKVHPLCDIEWNGN